ncbi:MAG: hypothetical protein U0610_08560 [bacterium]
MASPTQITERRRKVKTRRQNSSRKAALRRKGSTPPFPIHVQPADKPAGGQ